MASDVSQAPIIPRSSRGFSVSGYESGDGHFTASMDGVGRAVLPPVLGSGELQRLGAAGVRRVICSQLKLPRVHDRANYLGNEAENAGRLEYYIVKSFCVNSVCDQISCCFKYHITCSTLVWANEYVWRCHWICMPPNLINILTNSTSRNVWHKPHPSGSRLAQFVRVSYSFQNPSELAVWSYTPEGLGTSREGALQGCCSQGRDRSLSSVLSPRRSQLQPCLLSVPLWSLRARPRLSCVLCSAGDALPGKPCVWEGCRVSIEALRSRDWSGRLSSMCLSLSVLGGKV